MYNVKKQGTTYTAYVDPGDGSIQTFATFEEIPAFGLPVTSTGSWQAFINMLDQVGAKRGGLQFAICNMPTQPNPEMPQDVMRKGEQELSELLAPTIAAPVTIHAGEENKLVAHFRALVHSGAHKEEIEHVGTFLINLAPELETLLRQALSSPKPEQTRKKFAL